MKKICIKNIVGIPSREVVTYTVHSLIKNFNFFNRFQNIGPSSIQKLSEELGFDQRVFEATLDYLRKEGYVNRISSKNGYIYSLTNLTTEFLVKDAKHDLSAFAMLLEGNIPSKISDSIAYALRTGEPAKWDETNGIWSEAIAKGVITKAFSDGMMARGKYLCLELQEVIAYLFSEKKKLLDIGGSLGDYAGEFAKRFENLQCTVLDLPAVIEKAKKNIAENGYLKIDTIANDIFKDQLPKGYDIHFYSNVMHDWTTQQILELLRNSYSSLTDDGVVIVHDMHLDNNKKGPNHVVDHSLYLSIFTKGKCYSYKEMTQLMKNAGYKRTEVRKTVAGYSAIIGYKQ